VSKFGSVYIRDLDGNPIEVVSGFEDEKYLATAMIQDIHTSVNNFSEANILSGETWTGTADETLGVNGIQIFHSADRECTVYLDQSVDTGFTSELTITDSFSCLSNIPCTRTFVSVGPYFRIRVTNNDTIDTTVIITAAGMTPYINPLPRALSDDGRMKSECHITDGNDRHTWISRQNELFTTPVYRMVGTSFNTDYDTSFWLTGGTDGGAVSFNGAAALITSTDAAGYAKIDSVRKCRYVTGSSNIFRGYSHLSTDPVEGCTRRFGAYNDDNGFFMQLSGLTFSVGYRKATVDTLIETGSFNGVLGSNVSVVGQQNYAFFIEMDTNGARYYINSELLHSVPVPYLPLTQTLTLPIRAEVWNEGSTANNGLTLLATSLFRVGELHTNPTWKYFEGAQSEVCKYNAGTLHAIIVQDSSGSMEIWDGTDDTGVQIADIDLATGTLTFDLPYNNGLYIETTGAGANVVVTYE